MTSGSRRFFRDWVRYPLEAALAWLVLAFFGLFSPPVASAIGGWVGRTIGPRLPLTQRAVANIDLAMPGTPNADKHRIIRGMWDNLGRVLGEYPHLGRIVAGGAGYGLEACGRKNAAALDDEEGGRGLLIGGHSANWELFPPAMKHFGLECAPVYRPANNPLVDRMLIQRRLYVEETMVPKGKAGARKAMDILKRGGRLGLLIDQKMNDGISVPFFGHQAMTAPAVAQFALHLGLTVVPCWIVRLEGCRFRLEFHRPIRPPEPTGDRQAEIREMMVAINKFVEDRIREHPEQWLWLHRRWPKRPQTDSGQ